MGCRRLNGKPGKHENIDRWFHHGSVAYIQGLLAGLKQCQVIKNFIF
jgi:hypothetical protein